jgi:putative hydrolase
MGELGPTGPTGGDNPFGSFLGDMMKMFLSDGPLNWQLARQAALVSATGGESEPNVDPLDRLRLEQLLRVADLHVTDATGLSTAQAGGIVTVRTVTRAEWAYHTLDAYRPLFEALATALTGEQRSSSADAHPSHAEPVDVDPLSPDPLSVDPFQVDPFQVDPFHVDPDDPTGGLLGSLPQVLGPVMLGAQAGSLAGFLARRALGQYDLPIPRPLSDGLMMVPASINAFASDWSLPPDDLRLWVCLSELTHHAVLGREHVRDRLDSLLRSYAQGFNIDPAAIGSHLEGLDLSDPSALPEILNNPEALLGAVQTPGQRDTLARLSAVVAALEGYVDHIVDSIGQRLIASYGPLTEAVRRRRVEATEADRLISQLIGLQMGQATFDRGATFVRGVVERAGDAGLARLWHGEHEVPTPAEVDAPGLWLARIDIPV